MCVDLGDPVVSWTNEPAPNGGRINVGSYGNHGEASLSRTGAWCRVLTCNDGGTLRQGDTTYWTYGGMASGATVRVDISFDGGSNWTVAAASTAVGSGSYTWSNAGFPTSTNAAWRLVATGNTNVCDASDRPLTYTP